MATTTARPLEGKRILVVEDDFYLATDEKRLLEGAGAIVVGPFGSGSSPRDIGTAGEVDAAIVDVNLGEGPSFDFARMLQSRATPFVFVTGYDAGAIPPELADAPRLEKPIRERQLIAVLQRLVGKGG